ncbi:flagellar biosynthesis protein FlgN [Sulfitobacter sp. HNIBRBA2951]|uniref:flagellar biosynthesis protein FlgN n=1 Tax=Sulfitobacter aquimarinus TaxID=3158557 RepID=UPI0032DFEA76
MTHNIIDFTELDALLEQERTCLLEGDLEALGALLPIKEQLIADLLERHELTRDILAPIEDKLQRNQLLLDGALDGIKAVATRLAALRQVRTVLDTYDAQGRKKQVVTPTPPKIEKRA